MRNRTSVFGSNYRCAYHYTIGLKKVPPTRFELVHANIAGLESAPLDRSGKVAIV